ncbi:MAG: hypothetical protein RLZZ453_81 [Chlamydiota bacterium]|jgi:autotransporter-associated beta strand protein
MESDVRVCRFYKLIAVIVYGLFPFSYVEGATIMVTSSADSGADTFRQALQTASSGDTILFQSGLGTISLLSNLPAITQDLTITTQSGIQFIDGQRNQIFNIRGDPISSNGPNVSISNVYITNGLAVGGLGSSAGFPSGHYYAGGGGGGGGFGGGYFVSGNVSLDNVGIGSCTAIGGTGGSNNNNNLDVVFGGMGGGGANFSLIATPGALVANGYTGVTGGGDFGGSPGIGNDSVTGTICTNSFGQAGGTGGGGGGGGSLVECIGGAGGTGGYGGGGGGGAAFVRVVGATGLTAGAGGQGGFGGGGGGGGGANGYVPAVPLAAGGIGGIFGGNGGVGITAGGITKPGGGGGGGAGIGGAIFVYQDSILTVSNGATITDGSVVGGSGGLSFGPLQTGSPGTGFAPGVFLDQGSKLILSGPLNVLFSIDATAARLDGGLESSSNFVQINSNNTYLGPTIISGGTLAINSTGALGSATSNILIYGAALEWMSGSFSSFNRGISLSGTSNLQVDTALTRSLLNPIIGTGPLIVPGPGTLQFLGTSPSTYSNTTTVSGGVLFLNNTVGVTAIPGDMMITGGTVQLLANNQIADTSVVSISSGTFDLNSFSDTITSLVMTGGSTTLGGGTLTLSGTSSTTLSMGNGSSTISGAGSLTFSGAGGGITYNGTTDQATISSNIAMGSSTRTFAISNGAASIDLLISGVISNTSGGLTKTGAGTLQFSGTSANTYSGTTTVSAGTLSLNKTASVNAVPGDATINGGTLQLAASNQIANTSVVSISSGTFDLNSFSDTITSLVMTGGSTTLGGGTLTLSGTSSTTLSMGDGSSTISGAGSLTFSGAGGGITYNGTTDQATISSNIAMGSSTRTFTISNGAASIDLLISGVISNTSGGLTKTGAGTLQFSGTSANTYSGTTTVSAGTLSLNKTASVNAIPGNITINGGTLQLAASNQIANTSTVSMSSGAFDLNSFSDTITSLIMTGGSTTLGGGTLTLTGTGGATLSMGNGNTTISGAGSLTFSGAGGGITYNGTTDQATISSDIVIGSPALNFLLNNGAASIDLLVSGAISSTSGGGLAKLGNGTLQFSGTSANTYSGTTTLFAGTLSLNKTDGVNAISGNITMSGGTLQLAASNQIADTSTVSMSGGAFNLNSFSDTITSLVMTGGSTTLGGGTLTLSGTSSTTLSMGNGSSTISGAGSLTFSGVGGGITYNGTTSQATISSNIDMGSSTRTFTISNGSASIDLLASGAISGSLGVGLTKTGAGTLQLSGSSANTYSGTTTVSAGTLSLNKTASVNAVPGDATINGGTLQLVASNQIADTSTVSVSSGTFDLNSFSDTITSLVMTGGSTTLGGGTLTLSGTSSTTLSMGDGSSTISGAGSLTFSGAGGGITYNGTTDQATISSNIDMGSSTRTFTISNGAASIDLLISGVISNTSGGLTKTGAGTLQLSGSSANTYSGTTTVSAGTLSLNKTASVNAVPGDATINGGTLQLVASNQIADTSTVSVSSGTFDLNSFSDTITSLVMTGGSTTLGGGTLTLSGTSSTTLSMGDGSSTISGAGSLTFSGAGGGITYNGTTDQATISSNIDMGSSTRTFTISNGAASIDLLISGVISNTSGGLTKTGAGTLQLSGSSANTYSGTTTVSQGTLSLNKTVGVDAIPGDTTINGGTLQLAASDQIADTSTVSVSSGTFDLNNFSETITSLLMSGGSVNLGSGTLTLNGTTSTALTIGDGIAISGIGTIAFNGIGGGVLYNGGSLQALISCLVDLGTSNRSFDIGNGSAVTDLIISGNMSGVGASVTKTGAGTMSLTGNNSYTGLTTVSDGTLIVNTLSLPGTATNNSQLIFDQLSDASFNYTINGTGDLTIQGGGLLNLTQPISQNQITVALTGKLALNTSATADLTVDSSGYLQGTGPVIGSVIVSGTIAPGNSIATFDVVGPYTQAMGSTYQIECDPVSADLIAATDLITIENNTTVAIFPAFGTYPLGYQQTIMEGSSRVGTFSDVTLNMPSFQAKLEYTSTSVLLVIDTLPFHILPLDPAAQVVAHCLDSFFGDQTTVLQPVIDELHFMNLEELQNTLHDMLPTVFNTLDLGLEEVLIRLDQMIERQMDLHSIANCAKPHRIQVWNDLFFSNASQKTDTYRVGYKTDPWGNSLGCDIALGSTSRIGAALSYVEEPITWKENTGHARSQNGFFSFYAGGYFNHYLYMHGSLTLGLNRYHTYRNIAFDSDTSGSHIETAQAKTKGASGVAHFEIGACLTKGIRIRPFGKVDYAYLHRDGFKETGAGALNLKVQKHNADLLRVEAGLELLTSFYTQHDRLVTTPYISLGDAYEWRFVGKKETASLAPLTCPMVINGLFPQRNLYFFELGLIEGFFCDRAEIGCDYRQEWGHDYLNRIWSGQLRYNF